MSNQPKIGIEHKIVVGSNDVSYLPSDATPTGTSVLNGPVWIGRISTAPVYQGVLNVGPLAAQLTSGTKPPLVTATTMYMEGLFRHIGIANQIGIRIQRGMNFVSGERITRGLNFTSGINITTRLLMGRPVIEAGHILSAKKNFDIPHPSKTGHRLRYVCAESPEANVFVRGKSQSNVIILPDYWKDLVDEESITVNLTPVGVFQGLYVESIKENIIHIGGGVEINGETHYNFHYTVFAERKDCEKNIPEYEGESPKDYPGDSSQCSVAGWDY